MIALFAGLAVDLGQHEVGLVAVEAPSPLIGGSWPDRPAPGWLAEGERSLAISLPTIETSSSTTRSASRITTGR
jgi:hypothetical protein